MFNLHASVMNLIKKSQRSLISLTEEGIILGYFPEMILSDLHSSLAVRFFVALLSNFPSLVKATT